MKLFDNPVLYGPEQAGNGTPSPELSAQGLNELIPDSIEDREATALEGVDSSLQEGERVDTEFDLDALPDLSTDNRKVKIEESKLDELDGYEVEAGDIKLPDLGDIENEYSFQRDPETGLSSQLANIKALEAQLQALEEGEVGYKEIKLSIEDDRDQKKIEFENSLVDNKNKLSKIYTLLYGKGGGEGSFTGTQEQMVIINSYLDVLKGNPQYSETVTGVADKITAIKSQIETLTTDLGNFQEETESQIVKAVRDKKESLNRKLSQAKQEYDASDAKTFDTKILLERQLEEQLTDPDALFSTQNIDQIFATYGLEEGLNRLQQLREESTQAREQVARDKIRGDIFSYISDYQNNPDLAQALSADIQAKLKELQQLNPTSATIKRALSLEGPIKLDYLTNSQDPELKNLAFWFDNNLDIDKVLSRHPKFAEYVSQETDKRYINQQKDITEGRLGGRQYLNSEADKQLQQEIDIRIKNETNRYRAQSISNLTRQISEITSNDAFYNQDRQDLLMVTGRDQFGEIGLVTEANRFKNTLVELGSGIILSAEGSFDIEENPLSENIELAQQKNIIEVQIKTSCTEAGYTINTIADIDEVLDKVQADINTESEKRFRNKDKITRLEGLKTTIKAQVEEYNRLQKTIDINESKFNTIQANITTIELLYKKLPQYIQNKLKISKDKSISGIVSTIDMVIQELQDYETPSELKAQRDKITALQQQIEELERIT